MNPTNNLQNDDISNNRPAINYGTPILSWQSPEFIKHQRGAGWYYGMGIVVIILAGYGIIADSIIFSIVVILLAGVIFLTNKHQPKNIPITITDTGILYGEKYFPYAEIACFWVIFDPPHNTTLNLKVNKGMTGEITIQLMGQNPVEIKAYLGSEITEIKNKTETLADILIRTLKL